jgi:tetratricopeptide (TPR) repeat protein
MGRIVGPGSLAVAALVLASSAIAQDWRGTGRIQGSVSDEADKKPLVGATVKAMCAGRGGTTLKTDKKGQWVLGGVVGCAWQLDFEAEGYETKKVSVTLPSEESRLAPVAISLKRSAAAAPDLSAAAAKAEEAYKAGRFEEARAEYEKLLAARPELAGTIYQRIGFSYVQEKQYEPALAALDKALAADPKNAQVRAIAAQAALEGKKVDKARELLAGLDESGLQSPDVFYNVGINFFNIGESADAIAYFGKTIAKDPSYVDAYYRRGLAYLGQGKTAEAKADFQKVVELSPTSEMGAMAKKALDQLH